MMNFQQAAKLIGERYKAQGYNWRLEREGHKHARLYIQSGDQELFTPMSVTANYDVGNLLSIKHSDIDRDIIPKLPKPEVVAKVKNDVNGDLNEVKPEETRITTMMIYRAGRGTLVVQIPRKEVPTAKPRASILLSDDKRPYLVFSALSGKPLGKSRNPDEAHYYFKRSEVSFNYAEKAVPGFKAPTLCARWRGNTLVADSALPPELLTGQTKKTKCSLDDGKELRDMLNQWLGEAEKAGFSPVVRTKDNRVTIEVEMKITKEL